MGEAMGVNMDGLSDRKALDATVGALRCLVRDVGCDLPLTSFGASEEDLDDLVAEAMAQKRVMGHSTYKLSPIEVRQIFMNALKENNS
jgi:alcohol dehydrogenase class IV